MLKSLRAKLISLGVLTVALPMVAIAAFVYYQQYRGQRAAAEECRALADTDLSHIAKNVYSMCSVLDKTGKRDEADVLRQAIMDIKIGEGGYVYVLSLKGNYVVSKDGARDGENVWKAKDADGNMVIQDIIRKAKVLGPGEVGEHIYPWKNPDDAEPRNKIAKLTYYEPWGWVIGASVHIDEYMEAERRLNAINHESNIGIGVVITLALLVAVFAQTAFSTLISRKITAITLQLSTASSHVASASDQVSQSSQEMAHGANEQASNLEETSASLEELSAATQHNTDNSKHVSGMADSANHSAENGQDAMARMNETLEKIRHSADETGKIVKVVEEIAFQTNLLALNAAVEAARAGEAGKGFAVVAEEVRNLAQRSAQAARDTSSLIDDAISNSRAGIEVSTQVASALDEISDNVSKVTSLAAEVSEASSEQARGIEQINTAVASVNGVTQSNAANAEESASASEELSAQSRELNAVVQRLREIVEGRMKRRPEKLRSAHPATA